MRIFSLVSVLLAGASTLLNGIHIYDVPQTKSGSGSFEVVAGYRTGLRNEADPSGELAAVVCEFLKSTSSARSLALTAYGSAGKIQFVSDLERTGMTVTAPAWVRPAVVALLIQFLSEAPQKNPDLVDRAILAVKIHRPDPGDVRLRVEEQLQMAILGAKSKSALNSITRKTVEDYLAKYFGTDRAFVLIDGDTTELEKVPRRTSPTSADIPVKDDAHQEPPAAGAHLDSDLDEGAVLF